ncbi:MAG: polysaccharide lyase 6 family protein [Bacteroidota bacterium]|nr:polysaccharide lyase 6 family protein [Bacteroidota bacterium]
MKRQDEFFKIRIPKSAGIRITGIVWIVILLCFYGMDKAYSQIIHVNTISALQTAINRAKAGQQIIVDDGLYTTTGNIRIAVRGTKQMPVIIAAQKTGGVEIIGQGGFVVSSPSSYIVIKGFKFTHNTGSTQIASGATHCLITRNIFECAPVNSGTKAYLTVSGDDNEISYNTFQNKKDEGQMISVQGPGHDRMAKRTWIHHNYFYNFPPKANNCSAIQIGLSSRSMDSAFCVVEYNLFVKTAGENEGCICHKSCRNIIRFNTFGEGSEELSLRHGNKSEVYGNFFIGCTGLRFSGDDHKIYCNFFKNCSRAIVCNNGDGEVADGDKLISHDRPDRVQIVFNTMVDCASNYSEPNRKNGLGATNIDFSNNIIQGGEAVSIKGPYVNPVWKGNILWNTQAGSIPADGYISEDPNMSADINGIFHLLSGSSAIGAGDGSYPYVSIDIDGQARGLHKDTGADQFSQVPVTNHVLTTADVGPFAGLNKALSK